MSSKKKPTTIRFTESVDKALSSEAKKKGISKNSLANLIMYDYFGFDKESA